MRDAQTAHGRNVLNRSQTARKMKGAPRNRGALFVFGGHARRKVKNEKPAPNNSKEKESRERHRGR
jgi:hypothetical protein